MFKIFGYTKVAVEFENLEEAKETIRSLGFPSVFFHGTDWVYNEDGEKVGFFQDPSEPKKTPLVCRLRHP